MAKVFKCERDGAVVRGADDDELVDNVKRHVSDNHPDLVGTLTRDQILAMAEAA
jgi:hypothetical protein